MENDEIIRLMDNIGLVMILAHEILLEDKSQWNAYLNLLPASYTTPLFYSIEQLKVGLNILYYITLLSL